MRTFGGNDCNNGVSNNPGAIVTTRIPAPARSLASGNVNEAIAPFDAAYAV